MEIDSLKGRTIKDVRSDGTLVFEDGEEIMVNFNCGVYRIYCKQNGKSYVGCSRDIDRRIKSHFRSSSSPELKKDMEEFGAENFEVIIVEVCTPKEIHSREAHWIAYFNSVEEGYNTTTGSRGKSPIKVIKYSIEGIKECSYDSKKAVNEALGKGSVESLLNKPIIRENSIYVREGTSIEEVRYLIREALDKPSNDSYKIVEWGAKGELLEVWNSREDFLNGTGVSPKKVAKSIRKGNLCYGRLFTRGELPPKFLLERLWKKGKK